MPTTETAEVVDDVLASVTAAFDEFENDDVDDDLDKSTDTDAAVDTDDKIQDAPDDKTDSDDGDQDKATDEIASTDTETVLDKTPVADTSVDDSTAYPEQWGNEFKADFESLDPSAQKILVTRHKAMEADYTRKTMAIADLKRDYEGVDQTLRAFEPQIQAAGITKGEMIRRWAVAESHLNTQPIQAIKTLAAHYGVDLTALSESSEVQFNDTSDTPGYSDAQIDPKVQSLQAQVNNLETHNNQIVVNSFANQQTDKGEPAHPHFDELIPDIMNAMKAANAVGRYPELSELYEQACWTNTSVREKMITAQISSPTSISAEDKTQADKVASEARLKAAKAKEASKSVHGDSGSSVEAKPVYNSVEDAAKAAYDKHAT